MIPDIPFPPARMAAVRGAKAFPPYPGPYLESGGLEGEWRLALGAGVRAAAACAPLSIDLLSREELAAFRSLPDPSGRRAWLTGRAALRRLRERLGAGSEAIPGHRLSFGYAEGMAVAVACADPAGATVGVELAAVRTVPACLAPHFMTGSETEWAALREGGTAGSDRLRILTIKAALGKADPDRAGLSLAEYRLADPAARRGKAERADKSRNFRYVSHKLADWRLSLAVSKGGQGA